MRFYVASALSLRETGPSDKLIGTMKGLVDGYVGKYDAEKERYADAEKGMEDVIEHSKDDEAKARAVDEKIRLGDEHEEKLRDLTSFVRVLDDSVQAMSVSDSPWMEKFPDLKTKVDEIYAANPALIAKSSHVEKRSLHTAGTNEAAASTIAEEAAIYLQYIS